MEDAISVLTDFRAFLLIAFRISGLAMTAPFFSNASIPRKVKVGLTVALAVVVFPTVDRSGLVVPDNTAGYLAAVLAEIAVGAVIGLVASLIFAAIQLGGFIAARQVGLAIAHIYDPFTRRQTSIVSQVYFFFALTVFLTAGGHHMILRTVAASFNVVPLAGFAPGQSLGAAVSTNMAGQMFAAAVKLSAPAVITLMMSTMVMAIIARTVPEMNIFNIGFAIRLGLGLGVLTLMMPALGSIFQVLFSNLGDNLRVLLEAMRAS